MKQRILTAGLFITALIISSCNSNPNNWTEEQKKEHYNRCVSMIEGNDSSSSSDGSVEDFCDCTTDKTVEKYTYEESKDLTDDDMKKLLENCDYQW